MRNTSGTTMKSNRIVPEYYKRNAENCTKPKASTNDAVKLVHVQNNFRLACVTPDRETKPNETMA